ncbi:MAG TPA: hypothetical protein VFI70_01335 [Nitrososphaeraceae archaeon]|nr:hypothetical protein [Nitrososphaeraceae archaeon]
MTIIKSTCYQAFAIIFGTIVTVIAARTIHIKSSATIESQSSTTYKMVLDLPFDLIRVLPSMEM